MLSYRDSNGCLTTAFPPLLLDRFLRALNLNYSKTSIEILRQVAVGVDFAALYYLKLGLLCMDFMATTYSLERLFIR